MRLSTKAFAAAAVIALPAHLAVGPRHCRRSHRLAQRTGGVHHVPPYPNHVLGIDIQSPPGAHTPGSYVIKTSDSVAVVSGWYKQHLPDLTSAKTTPDGHHLFFTKSGATVDVGKAIPFDGNYTIIGVVDTK